TYLQTAQDRGAAEIASDRVLTSEVEGVAAVADVGVLHAPANIAIPVGSEHTDAAHDRATGPQLAGERVRVLPMQHAVVDSGAKTGTGDGITAATARHRKREESGYADGGQHALRP